MLKKSFFAQEPETVAKGLIGRNLVRRINKEIYEARIVETGAYQGKTHRVHDKGFEYEAGTIHIWHGQRGHKILTISTYTGEPSVVSVRKVMPRRSLPSEPRRILGPGKLTKELKIAKNLIARI